MSLSHLFFFNDCIPKVENNVFVEKLVVTLIEFNELLKKDIQVARGIVTHLQPSLCYFGENYNLQDAINLINDKSTRDLAYSLFIRFPVGKPHFNDDYEELINESYEFPIKEKIFDALNLAIVNLNNGYIFSLALAEELCSDKLEIFVKNTSGKVELPNIFGEKNNTKAIQEIIEERNRLNLEIFEQLLGLFKVSCYSNQFRKDFDNLSETSKKLIISHFKDAKSRNLPTNFAADGDLIKDVSPVKKKCDVFELRVFKGKALRVYFSEVGDRVYLSNIGFKNNNQQDQDIKNAHTTLYRLILIN